MESERGIENTLSQIYTRGPAPSRNPILGSLQLLAWLFLRNSAWQHYITRIDPNLSAHFCLAELRKADWHNPALRQLLVRGYLITPLIFLCLLSLVLGSIGRLTIIALTGFAFGVAIGIGLGVIVSAAVGMAVITVTGVTFGLAWSSPDMLMIDMVLGVRFAIIFGLTSAIAIYVTGNVFGRRFRALPEIQLGSFLLGTLASVAVAAFFIWIAVLTIRVRREGVLADYGTALVVGGLPGVFLGLATAWRTLSWRRGLLVGMASGLVAILILGDIGREYGRDPGGEALLRSFSLMTILTYLTLFLLPFVIVERLTGSWAGIIVGAIGGLAVHPMFHMLSNLYALRPNFYVGSLSLIAGLTMPWWRPVLFYPFEAGWNILLYLTDERRPNWKVSLLHWHAALWDELQWLPMVSLDDHLLLVHERNPEEARIAIRFLSGSRQSWAAQAVQIELDARQLQRYESVSEIAYAPSNLVLAEDGLEGPARAFLRSFSAIGRDVAAALAQRSIYNQRLVLGEIEDRLNGLLREIARTNERYAKRFLPVVDHWLQLIGDYLGDLSRQAETRQEIENPYVVGVPLTKRQEIFVGRVDICARIEEFLRDQDHPPLLLYGQRRMGKTSLLYQLRWLLPQRIVPLVVDLQGPVSLAGSHASFLYNLGKGMTRSAGQQGLAVPQLRRDALAGDPFTTFDDWLDQVEMALAEQGRHTLLLALDEFEALDTALAAERLDEEAVLGTLRHIIQHRPAVKMLLAGSHTLDEFRRWSGYFINAQVIHLSYLSRDEARQLVERPVEDFSLVYEAEASQRVIDLTRGHPYLVQLLCAEIVRRKNEHPLSERYRVTLDDVNGVLPAVLISGSQFFSDIELNQVGQSGRMLLRFLAKGGEGGGHRYDELSHRFAKVDLKVSLAKLADRELIELVDSIYRFQVELVRKWFARRDLLD